MVIQFASAEISQRVQQIRVAQAFLLVEQEYDFSTGLILQDFMQ